MVHFENTNIKSNSARKNINHKVVASLLIKACSWYLEYRSQVRAIAELNSFNDHQLSDIGLTRDDLSVPNLTRAANARNRLQNKLIGLWY